MLTLLMEQALKHLAFAYYSPHSSKLEVQKPAYCGPFDISYSLESCEFHFLLFCVHDITFL